MRVLTMFQLKVVSLNTWGGETKGLLWKEEKEKKFPISIPKNYWQLNADTPFLFLFCSLKGLITACREMLYQNVS